ncbi:MAG: hypothetical protein ACLFVT_09470 [Syntrophobacteria bacterium]
MSAEVELFQKRFATGAHTEATVSLVEAKQGLFLQLQTQRGSGPDAEIQSRTAIPAALLPELKRAIGEVEKILSERGELDDYDNGHAYQQTRTIAFANESECEFARILDFYKIAWEYEPTTFPITWDDNGYVRESFTPDFYLPDYGLFIELTTMKQSLVTKKTARSAASKKITRTFPSNYSMARITRPCSPNSGFEPKAPEQRLRKALKKRNRPKVIEPSCIPP